MFHGPNQCPGLKGRPVCSQVSARIPLSGVVFFPLVPTSSARLYVGVGSASSLVNAEVIRPEHGARSDRCGCVFRGVPGDAPGNRKYV